MESKLAAIISSAEFQNFLDEVIAREVKEFFKNDSQQLQPVQSNQRQLPPLRIAPQQTPLISFAMDMLNESLKVKMKDKIDQLVAFGTKNLTPIKPLIENSSQPAAEISIENEEPQAKVPAKDERNLVFPLLSKTYFPGRLFTILISALCGVLMVPLYATTISYGWSFAFENDAVVFP